MIVTFILFDEAECPGSVLNGRAWSHGHDSHRKSLALWKIFDSGMIFVCCNVPDRIKEDSW